MTKTANILSAGLIWARLEKKYLHSDWFSYADIWMENAKEGDLYARKSIFKYPFIAFLQTQYTGRKSIHGRIPK